MAKKPAKTGKTPEPETESAAASAPEKASADPAMVQKVAQLRSAVRETFGSVAMSMMSLPRYRHLSIGDMQHLILEPLVRDRIALAKKASDNGALADIAGLAIWASVTEEVDAKIREQISAGVFPIRLKPDEWAGGKINWLFDVIAPDRDATAAVIANFRAVAKEGQLRLHPLVTRLVDREQLEKMGAKVAETEKAGAA